MISVYNEPWELLELDLAAHSFPGKLLCFEGIDGSGKSSVLSGVKTELERVGYECCVFRSPSETLRTIEYWDTFARSMDHERGNVDPFGLSILALGDRLIVQERYIKHALKRGCYVLMDRYILNQVLYQSCEAFAMLSKYIYKPDFGFIIDVDPQIARKRICQRQEIENNEDDKAKSEIRERFILLGKANGYITINTDKLTVEAAVEKVLEVMGVTSNN